MHLSHSWEVSEHRIGKGRVLPWSGDSDPRNTSVDICSERANSENSNKRKSREKKTHPRLKKNKNDGQSESVGIKKAHGVVGQGENTPEQRAVVKGAQQNDS